MRFPETYGLRKLSEHIVPFSRGSLSLSSPARGACCPSLQVLRIRRSQQLQPHLQAWAPQRHRHKLNYPPLRPHRLPGFSTDITIPPRLHCATSLSRPKLPWCSSELEGDLLTKLVHRFAAATATAIPPTITLASTLLYQPLDRGLRGQKSTGQRPEPSS